MEKYIDLGLPSGKLWKAQPEKEYYTFYEAKKKFGNNFPTKEDFEELLRHTVHKWDYEKKGMFLISKSNSKASIFLPAIGFPSIKCPDTGKCIAVGEYGSYWSITENYGYRAYFINIDVAYPDWVGLTHGHRYLERGIILIK